MNERICVLGAGAWGRALAAQAARAGHTVALWARDPARVPPGPGLTGDFDAAQRGASLIVAAAPMQALRTVLAALPAAGPPLLLAAKGMEAATGLLPCELAAALHPARAAGVLTGPNFAAEIEAGLPAAAIVAATDGDLRTLVARALGTAAFRLYGNGDPIGAGVGGAAKNVLAIAAGAVVGAGLGENARAALITRGLAELSRLVVALGGRAETASGLSGLGDLLLTATGGASRNYAFGFALGRGGDPDTALRAAAGVVEGATTAPALVTRATAHGLELPICGAVAALLAGRLALADAVARLLARPLRDE